jgi:hypothetical protein
MWDSPAGIRYNNRFTRNSSWFESIIGDGYTWVGPVTELLVKEEISLKLPFPELTDDQFFDLCAAHSDIT